MKSYYIIKRFISSYSGEDLFFGIFDDKGLAHSKLDEYKNRCKEEDEFSIQAYHDVDIDKDCTIEDVSSLIDSLSAEHVHDFYFVFEYSECFGQIEKAIKRIYDSELGASNFIKRLESDMEEDFLRWYEIEKLVLNKWREPEGNKE